MLMKMTLHMIVVAAITSVYASVPLKWTVETSRVQPVTFEAYHGETLSLEATLQSYGKPYSTGFNDYQIYWQTNGMEDVYWSAPAACQDNVETARFTPEMDTGANVVRGFLGCPGEDFRAAFQIRLRPSPGATPNAIDLPASMIDFAKVSIQNAPWATVTLVNELFDRNQHPVPYVISETATYHYDGSASIPAGDYYKATTGDGYVRYAAQVPMPKGRIVMSGDDDDPVLQYFGSVFRISSIATRISALSSMIDVGKYQVADLTFAPDVMLGLQATFHVNLLNPVPELTGITMQPTSGYIEFTDDRGVRHTIYSMWQSGPMSYTYSDETYDPNEGWWNETQRTISVGFERDGDTTFGFAVFGGSPIATLDQIDSARSKKVERTGMPGELGSGWGYKIYDFTNDERMWELQTPRLNTSLAFKGSSINIHYRQTVYSDLGITPPGDAASNYVYGLYDLREGDIKLLPNSIVLKEVVSTSNKYSTAGCQYVDYKIGIMAIDANRTDSVANGRYAITLDATGIAIGVSGRPYRWGDLKVAEVIDGVSFTTVTNIVYKFGNDMFPATELKTTFSNFRIGNITTDGYTKTVTVNYSASYECHGIYLSTDGSYKLMPDTITNRFDRSFSVILTTSSSLETTRVHANKVITDYSQHMFWDPGMKCTWEMGVTNGMFWIRKASTDDYRREEYVR